MLFEFKYLNTFSTSIWSFQKTFLHMLHLDNFWQKVKKESSYRALKEPVVF